MDRAMLPEAFYTVTEITAHIKQLFGDDATLRSVWLSAEVSNFKQASSGHCYFTLKDERASIKAVIWRTSAAQLALPRDGDSVICHGYVSVYEPQGVYQYYVDHLEPAGVGRLWLEFERLKARLAAEGLFEPERKRPIPEFPQRIGVVTSANAAALRDILRTLQGRYPLVEVLLAPCLVQGEAAPPSIIAALALLNRWSREREPLDAIIVARGGGSIEELWAFNDERVARAIAMSAVPVISGIGHETDFTIADFVADRRAPTPTGAATAATPDVRELAASVAALAASIMARTGDRVDERRVRVEQLSRRLNRVSPLRRVADDRLRLEEMSRRGELALNHRLRTLRERLGARMAQLKALDPGQVLARGYAIITLPDGTVVTSRLQVATDDNVGIRVADGAFAARVTGEIA